MEEHEMLEKVLNLAVEQWNVSFGGTSALDISSKIGAPNEDVMLVMEKLCAQSKGTINANIELTVITIDTGNLNEGPQYTPSNTHIFFPSKAVLTEHFYSSSLVRKGFPEYKIRLHQGANQLHLVMFSDEVLARYFDHPELYEMDDSLSGGHILTKSEAPQNRHLYVRHGKRKLKSGKTAVTAILKDLYDMSDEEQHHWRAYELPDKIEFINDDNFSRFINRTYNGSFVDYIDPLTEITTVLKLINNYVSPKILFSKTENIHLRLPVENTEKAFCDCCSELYKLIGPDNIKQNTIKNILVDKFNLDKTSFTHKDSKKNLSTMQLLELLEGEIYRDNPFCRVINSIKDHRTTADHKIISAHTDDSDYVDLFTSQCEDIINSGSWFESCLRNSNDYTK